MIKEEQLFELGFKDDGWCNNRHFYSKGKFNIIEHFGYEINYESGAFYGKPVKTIKGIKSFMNKYKTDIYKQIEELKQSLLDD